MALIQTFPLDTKTYGFEWLRRLLGVTAQEGVVDVSDFKVTAPAAGGMRVDVAAGLALVQGDTGFRNGLYLQVNDAAIANAVTLDAADASPRVDQIVLELNDSSDLADVTDAPTLRFVKGVPTAGATLDNAYTTGGAAALPDNCLRLADVLVPAGSTAVSAGNIRDRRPWARGAHNSVRRTSGDATSTDTTNFAVLSSPFTRLECSGGLITMTIKCRLTHSAAGGQVSLMPYANGAPVGPWSTNVNPFVSPKVAAGGDLWTAEFTADLTPSRGSHLFQWAMRPIGAGTATLHATAGIPLTMHVLERTQQDGSNT